ncbi:MAG: cation diffusion facilitator family transporter [Lentisphaeria bacterium]|nr:cation diffusion facilitator family transporter [Lentisphaeria bacterium]
MLDKLFTSRKASSCDNISEQRSAYGRLCGLLGIGLNAILFVAKLLLGLYSSSLAIAADAVNNLSDAGAAVITLITFKSLDKQADSEHPFGHGRGEYIAGLIMAVIIIAVAMHFMQESLLRLFQNRELKLSRVGLLVYALTMPVKLALLIFYGWVGRRFKSDLIKAAAYDSMGDLLVSLGVLGSVLLAPYTKFPLDGLAGLLVALMLLAGGIKIVRRSIDLLLGNSPDPSLVQDLKKRLLQCEGIMGVHDIIVHNYGANKYYATAHAEVNSDAGLRRVHDILEEAQKQIAESMPVNLLLHFDPFVTDDPKVRDWFAKTRQALKEIDPAFKMYDFHLLAEKRRLVLHFNVLIPREHRLSKRQITAMLAGKLKKGGHNIHLQVEYVYPYV